MRGSKQHFSIQLLLLFDAVLIWVSFVIAAQLRGPVRDILGMSRVEGEGFEGMLWVIYIAVPLTPLILERFGHYDRPLSKRGLESLNGLARGILMIMLIVGIVAIFGRITDTKRLILGSGFLFSFFLLWFRSVITSKILRSRAASEGFLERVVLAGPKADTEEFESTLDPELAETWKVVSHFDLESESVDDLNALLKKESVQRVVFLAKHTEFERVSRAVETCEVQGVEAWVGASFMQTQVARPSFDTVNGLPMLVFRSTPELSWQLFAKKVVDIVGALLILVFSSPFWIAAIIGIRFSSPGAPVIFRQQRSGLYGRPFRIYKFRTMVADAENLLEQVKEDHGNEVDGPAFKLKTDPRIFPFGKFLRKYSIDELPQVINVLRGEMSLVGPRPLPLHEIDAIANSAHRRRLSMKPGITCLWQISGRSDITDFDEWVKLDVEYIDRWSIWEDFRILLKTIPAVLFSKGAR
jgi:exopolysaccharide biosynthesis polyprenyl glycosylphosphotransferase